jgi:putative transposase
MYPNKDTEKKLVEALETCRWLYNRLLEETRTAMEDGKPLRMYDCHNMIPLLKDENPRYLDRTLNQIKLAQRNLSYKSRARIIGRKPGRSWQRYIKRSTISVMTSCTSCPVFMLTRMARFA